MTITKRSLASPVVNHSFFFPFHFVEARKLAPTSGNNHAPARTPLISYLSAPLYTFSERFSTTYTGHSLFIPPFPLLFSVGNLPPSFDEAYIST